MLGTRDQRQLCGSGEGLWPLFCGGRLCEAPVASVPHGSSVWVAPSPSLEPYFLW